MFKRLRQRLRRRFGLWLRVWHTVQAERRKTAHSPVTAAGSHLCPRCTAQLPMHPIRPYNYCPHCGLRVEYPEDEAGYALTVVTRSERQLMTTLYRSAEQMADALERSGAR